MRRWLLLGLALVAASACGGDDDDSESQAQVPRADLIEPALDAVVAERGADDVELIEVAADLEVVDVIVRDGERDGAGAVLYRYDGETLTGPIEPRPDERPTFSVAEVTIEPDSIFEQVEAELPGSAIIDLAVRAEGNLVVNDATVASQNGGVLLVLLQPDGTIIGMQPV
jgi:hypothetical protein